MCGKFVDINKNHDYSAKIYISLDMSEISLDICKTVFKIGFL